MFIAVDIGGTNTRIAISKDGKKISKKVKYETPKKYDDGLDLLQDEIEKITNHNVPKTIVVGAASPIDHEKGSLIRPPALPNWAGHAIRKELELRLHTKILLENDSALGGLGEAHSKSKKKYERSSTSYKVLAYVTLSTGIGGVRIVNGKIDYQATPSEPGHQILDPKGRFWPGCGQKGCFEALCSGKAFEIEYGVKPEHCEDFKIWENHAKTCSQGLINVITLWSPDILIIGGSLIKAGHKFTDPLVYLTSSNLKIFPAPRIEISKMDDNNTLVGGFIYASKKYQ